MNHALSCLVLVLALAAGCTRENAAFCCIDPADCAAQGIDESRQCTSGLSCVENQCVASMCATTGCAAATPVCEVTTDVCLGCTDSAECMRFPATDVCDMTSGACVECVSGMDCDGAKPVCDAAVCRTCKLDSECPSGACAEDGTCVAEANVVYLSATGTNTVPCSRSQPCATLFFAAQQTNNPRSHIVFAPGNYTHPAVVSIGTGLTTASLLTIHGGGAILTGNSDDGLLDLRSPSIIRDIELVNVPGRCLFLASTVTVERVKVRGGTGIGSSGTSTLREVDVQATNTGIQLEGGSLRIDRVVVRGGLRGVAAVSPSVIDFVNVMVVGASEIGMDLSGVTGTGAFMTVAGNGLSATTGPTQILCGSSAMQISASIVRGDAISARPTMEGGCTVLNSIVGPGAFPGGMDINPGFLNAAASDYHLAGGSSARDMANTGPTHDFEGDSRPRGVRFDLGADEAP